MVKGSLRIRITLRLRLRLTIMASNKMHMVGVGLSTFWRTMRLARFTRLSTSLHSRVEIHHRHVLRLHQIVGDGIELLDSLVVRAHRLSGN